MKHARISSLLLTLALILASCGSTEGGAVTTDNDSSTTTAEESTSVIENFEKRDFSGMTYTIMARPVNKADVDQIAPETMNGEVVNDAVYKRNLAVSDY